MLDTIYTLEAMNTDVFVIRDSEAGMPEILIDHVAPHVSVISAGEAHVSHPTQGLLDVLTIRSHGVASPPQGGDRRRYRALPGRPLHGACAAHARRHGCEAGGARIAAARRGRISGGAALHPDRGRHRGADVVMMLRIQKERMEQAASLDDAAYFRDLRIGCQASEARLGPMRSVMHPGPMNRGVEISSEVADGPNSVIREQVNNGVAVRMAVLAAIAATLTRHRRPL